MIQALQYEPQGQRQRFELPEQQDRHIHLHFHLHLTLRARQGRWASIDARLVKGMLAAAT